MSHPRVILYTRSHISSVINGCPAPILTPFLPSSKRKKIPSTKKTVAVRVQEYIIFTSDPMVVQEPAIVCGRGSAAPGSGLMAGRSMSGGGVNMDGGGT